MKNAQNFLIFFINKLHYVFQTRIMNEISMELSEICDFISFFSFLFYFETPIFVSNKFIEISNNKSSYHGKSRFYQSNFARRVQRQRENH